MKEIVQEYQFVDVMAGGGVVEYGFSYEGARALYYYLIELEDDVGVELEFDPIALRREWTEYDSLADVTADYSEIETVEDLRDDTIVIEIPDSERLIVCAF